MSEHDTRPASEPDILAEIQAEVAQDLADERPPVGGPANQVVAALGAPPPPGPGLWPLVVSVLIVVLAVTLLVVGRSLDDAEKFTRASLLVLAGGATFIGLGLLLPTIGFEVPAILLGIVWLRFLGGETWRSTILVSVLTTAAFYVLFLYVLSIPLPHLIAF